MAVRNLSILVACQLISAAGAIVLVTLGGIIGSELTDNQALATLPVPVMVLSLAATTIPATFLMRAIGRKLGYALASLSAAVSASLTAYAISVSSFSLLIAAAAIFGINMAFAQQYRFAAAESVAQSHAGRAISIVLIGSIGGAFVGAELLKQNQFLTGSVPYTGSLVAVAVLYVIQSLLLLSLGPLRGEEDGGRTQSQRPLGQVVRQPVFIVAVLGGTVAHGMMMLIMTGMPLSMHINDGYSLEATANVMRAHVLGMYVPSLVSGLLIERIGMVKMMSAGAIGLLAAALIGAQGQSITHYWLALALLGVGWNFLYIGGTAMLTLTYSIAERFKAQAVNEFGVFGTSAAASLLAGPVMYHYGWHTLVLLPIPLLLVVGAALIIVRRDPFVQV